MGGYFGDDSLTMTVEVPSTTCTFAIRPSGRKLRKTSLPPKPLTKKATKRSALATKKYGVTVPKPGGMYMGNAPAAVRCVPLTFDMRAGDSWRSQVSQVH